jgi:hypothetical protein
MSDRVPVPKPSFEDSPVPELARKEKLLGDVATYAGVKEAIDTSYFCSKTKLGLTNMLNVACGRELLMANQRNGNEVNTQAEFMCWVIEKEAMLPREDRELEDYVDITNAIKILYNLNMTQSVQDKRGRNTWYNQYSNTSESTNYNFNSQEGMSQQSPGKKGGIISGIASKFRKG